VGWDLEKLKALPQDKLHSLWRNARPREDVEARRIVSLISENDLLREPDGGLPFDHPIMLEIERICAEPEAINEAVAASESGLPALAGMEYRLRDALGEDYGGNYTTNHAGRCIAEGMISRGWSKVSQKPMPPGSVAQSATTFVRRGA
jgi:hypothetical protein